MLVQNGGNYSHLSDSDVYLLGLGRSTMVGRWSAGFARVAMPARKMLVCIPSSSDSDELEFQTNIFRSCAQLFFIVYYKIRASLSRIFVHSRGDWEVIGDVFRGDWEVIGGDWR